MSATATLVSQWNDGKRHFVVFTVAFAGNYSTGGDTLDLSAFAGLEPPLYVEIHSRITSANSYQYNPGTIAGNGKLIASELGVEEAAGAYGADFTGDSVIGLAIFLQSM